MKLFRLIRLLLTDVVSEGIKQNGHEEVHERQFADHEHWDKIEHGRQQAGGFVARSRHIREVDRKAFEDSQRRRTERFEMHVRAAPGRKIGVAEDLHPHNREDEHPAAHEDEQVGDLGDGPYEGEDVPVHRRPLSSQTYGAHDTNDPQQSDRRDEARGIFSMGESVACDALQHELSD